MTDVLMVASTPPQEAVLTEALQRFRAKGARVRLACFFDPDKLPAAGDLAELHAFAVTGDALTPRFRKAVRQAKDTRRVWLHARRSAWVREHARRADLLVAVDPKSVHTVWELAQRNVRADAVYGLVPALKALDRRAGHAPAPALAVAGRRVAATAAIPVRGVRRFTRQSARTALFKSTGPRAMGIAPAAWFWGRVVTAPRVPGSIRGRLTLRLHTSMVRAGRADLAARTSTAAARKLTVGGRADLLRKEAMAEFDLGRVPTVLHEAISAQLGLADARLGTDVKKAVIALSNAYSLAANRVLHFDRLTSPLVDDPAAFLAPFRRSAAVRELTAPRGRVAAAAAPPSDRPLRLLFATLINDNFLREIRQRYEEMPGVEVRFLDLDADPVTRPLTRSAGSVMEHRITGRSAFGDKIEQWLRPHLDWADTVFVDWCQAQAALFTLQDPGTTRIVVRLHSFEAFNSWPHLVDYSRVDDMVFVSDHLRDLTTAVLPQLVGAQGPRLHVLSNAMDLQPYPRPKPAEARFNLGLVGVGAVAKDSRWAIEVVRELRRHDERYQLLLIGSDLKAKTSAAATQYNRLLQKDLDELEPAGAVQRRGQTDDVPGALAEIGVILSSSVRESFHCGLVEGAASGAVPVVRDWPFFAGKAHGARTLFPADWVVATPKEAAELILAQTATEERWRAAGQAASAHAVATWDWTVTRQGFDDLLLELPKQRD